MTGSPIVPAFIITLLATVAAGVTDLWKHKVYNLLTLPLIISGLLYHYSLGGSSALVDSLQGLLVGLGLLLLPWLLGGIGAGDVKLLAGVGAWLGPGNLLRVFIIAAVVGGVWAIFKLLLRREGWKWFGINLYTIAYRTLTFHRVVTESEQSSLEIRVQALQGRTIPLGVCIAIGVLALAVIST